MTCASASGERKLNVGASASVASTQVPSQNRIANGRRGRAASISRRSGAVRAKGKTAGSLAFRRKGQLARAPPRVHADHIPGKAGQLHRPDDPGGGIDLPAAQPVAVGGGKRVMVVV